ncbi:PREDICTED: E3 ubiquitin-protein ligase RNF170-like [Cariama cristata]|uniref:E3 ubiquitin-protein ligase RNF170-like n=1 Tax=Cariama cristata TaxID=54380 RepID=UPI0005205380|nr:PREDICTED: E3 ubiquitin-protein ligase RNF170-like [Cariama cristata]
MVPIGVVMRVFSLDTGVESLVSESTTPAFPTRVKAFTTENYLKGDHYCSWKTPNPAQFFPRILLCTCEDAGSPQLYNMTGSSLQMESLQIWQPSNHSDSSCPICLQTATLPVETNCGHLFCGSCLITYWKHSPWLAAITCPLCRQKVVLLDNISCEKQQDKPSKQTAHDIRDYNKRFSGQPRPFADYLYDMPLFLTLALRGIFTWDGLVWIFFLRVAVCSFGTIICLSSPFDMKPGPLCRTLGTADDMVVVSLLLICMINICQQIASNGVNMARSAAPSVLSES